MWVENSEFPSFPPFGVLWGLEEGGGSPHVGNLRGWGGVVVVDLCLMYRPVQDRTGQ
jgi:hypothetical protein